MASLIKIKRSAVAGKAPTTSNIENGELALNTADGRLFSSDGSLVFEIGANVHSLAVGTGSFTIANGAITFPTSAGSDGQVLTVDGSGNLSFTDNTSVFAQYTFIATAGQTTFSGSDSNGDTLSYDVNKLSVFMNGAKLVPSTDYTATNGTSIVLTEQAGADDLIEVQSFGSVANVTVAQDELNDGTNVQVEVTSSETTVKNDLVVEGDIKSDSFYFVKRSTDTSISYPGGYGSVTIDYEDAVDDYGSTDAMWSSATDRFTPTVAGLWFFRASIDAYPGATSEAGIIIEKNGTAVAQTSTIGFIRGHVVTHLYMNGTTDYVQFKAYTQGATTRGQSGENSFFEALLVKQTS